MVISVQCEGGLWLFTNISLPSQQLMLRHGNLVQPDKHTPEK